MKLKSKNPYTYYIPLKDIKPDITRILTFLKTVKGISKRFPFSFHCAIGRQELYMEFESAKDRVVIFVLEIRKGELTECDLSRTSRSAITKYMLRDGKKLGVK